MCDMGRSAAILLALAHVLAACSASGLASDDLVPVATPERSTTPSANAPTPTATPSQATAAPTATPSKVAPRDALLPETLVVVGVDGLNLRDEPGTTGPIQTAAPGGPTSGGPIPLSAGDLVWILQEDLVEGARWYHIVQENSFMTGWVSGGPELEPWLTPFDASRCPSSLSEALSEGSVISPRSLEHLACFEADELQADVYWPSPEEGQFDVPCPWPDLEPQWLICWEAVNVKGDESRQLFVYGTQGRDDITRGAWVTITGHYDDPRSADCPEDLGYDTSDPAEVAATVLSCRAAFVLGEIRAANR